MKMAYGFLALLSFTQWMGSLAQASATHVGKIDLEIALVDAKGKSEKITSQDATFRVDWDKKKCEAEVKGQFAYCDLDTSRDLTNAKGELVMKFMPQARFDSKTIDALIKAVGSSESKYSGIINAAVDATAGDRAKTFDFPFYTCANEFSSNPDCLKNGADLLIYNAFAGSKTNANPSYVLRQIEINYPSLGGKKLVFKLKLHDIKPMRGAFNIIGNNNAGNFGSR